VVISDDTDLAHPIAVVRQMGVRVIVASPRHYRLIELVPDARELRPVKRGALADCQMPESVKDHLGNVVTRPTDWS
jgi:uncharacterized LabA/DUF88 family protein